MILSIKTRWVASGAPKIQSYRPHVSAGPSMALPENKISFVLDNEVERKSQLTL